MSNFTDAELVKAISGSGGIITVIARRLGCGWREAEEYINSNALIKVMYDTERESIVDLCESVVLRNVQLAQEAQTKGEMGDTADAKWILSRLGKERGYAERQEVTGKNGAAVGLTSASLIEAMRAGIYTVDEEKRNPEESEILRIT